MNHFWEYVAEKVVLWTAIGVVLALLCGVIYLTQLIL